jgi:CubicO group peptidase (beta-lactamase class C family)
VLAGRLVEVLTGVSFERAARELLLEPLGMTHSFLFAGEVMTYRFAVGHFSPFVDGEPNTVLRPWGLARAANPAGGLVSTVGDLLRYARLHLGLGPDGVIGAETRAAMQTEWAPAGNFAEAVGAAWMLRGQPPRRVVGHGGSTLGQQALLEFAPQPGVAVAVLTNGSRGSGVHGRISRWVMREYAGIDEPEPEVRHLAAAELAEYVGRYEQAMSSIELVAGDDGTLVAQVTPRGGFPVKDSPAGPTPPPARLGFWAADRLLGLDPPWVGARAEFLRDASGRIIWLRIGGRLAARQ